MLNKVWAESWVTRFSGQRQEHAIRIELNERIQARVGLLEVLSALARPVPWPATSRTYQARPRLVARDSRLSPVRGSAQPTPPRASGFFLPSLRFSGSGAATLGPGFFRLFTSDMSGALKISKPGWLYRGTVGRGCRAAFGRPRPLKAAPRPKLLAPPLDSATRLKLKTRGCAQAEGRRGEGAGPRVPRLAGRAPAA